MKADFSKVCDIIHNMKIHTGETSKTCNGGNSEVIATIWEEGYRAALETLLVSVYELQKTANEDVTLRGLEEAVVSTNDLLGEKYVGEAAMRLDIARRIAIPQTYTVNLHQLREFIKGLMANVRALDTDEMRGGGIALSRFMYYLDLFKNSRLLGENGDYSELIFEAYGKTEIMMPATMDPLFSNGYRTICNYIKAGIRSCLHKHGTDMQSWSETELIGVIV